MSRGKYGFLKFTAFVLLITLFLVVGCEDASPVEEEIDEEEEEVTEEEEAVTEEAGLPDTINAMTYDVGGAVYISTSTIGEVMLEKYDQRYRVTPSSTSVARHYPLRTQDAHMAFTGIDAFLMQEGIMEYADIDWGPQPIRILWFSQTGGLPLAVRGDSDIETIEDLEGRKVATYPGSEAITITAEANVRFGGFTWDDVEPVEVASLPDGVEQAMAGEIDAAIVSTGAPLTYEWADRSWGIRYLELPLDNQEGWEMARVAHPEFTGVTYTSGAGIAEGESIEVGTASSPRIVALDWLDDEIAYFVTKVVHEEHEELARRYEPMGEYWTMEQNFIFFENSINPFHEGTVRYLEEIGVWTEEHEAMQQERLQRQEELKALWDEVLEEAIEEGISSADYPEFWLERRAEAGF